MATNSKKPRGGKRRSAPRPDAGAAGNDGSSRVLTVIDEAGRVGRSRAPGLADDELLRLYRTMVRTRVMEDRALALQRQGRIGFYVPCTGQEASHVGTAAALRETDWIFPAYRQAGIPLLRGVPIQQVVDEWYGNEGDICKGRQMPVHYSFRQARFVSISSPIGTQLTQATGAAMAARYLDEDTVVMTYVGDGGTSENDFHAALNFAGVYKAPVVFVCENNHWAISTPLEYQTASETIAVKGEAYGIPGVRVDGNDVLAVHQVAEKAVDRARKGKGPTLIESLTYRVGPHSSSDDPTRYREASEVVSWQNRDPITRFGEYLKGKKLLSEEVDGEIHETAKAEVQAAVKRAEEKAPPPVSDMFEDVFRDMIPQLEEQRADLLALGDPRPDDEGSFPL